MLAGNLGKRAVKGTRSREPFVDHDCKRVLITGRTRFALKLFRSHVVRCACYVLPTLGARGLGNQGNAKVAEQDLLAASNEQVLRFNVPVYYILIMREFKSRDQTGNKESYLITHLLNIYYFTT